MGLRIADCGLDEQLEVRDKVTSATAAEVEKVDGSWWSLTCSELLKVDSQISLNNLKST